MSSDSSDSEETFEDPEVEYPIEMDVFNLPKPLLAEGNMDHNWKLFKEEYEIYMTASEKSKKAADVRAAIFLNLVGEYGRQLCTNFNMAAEDKKDVVKVMARFENFCAPKKNIIYERFKFNQRSQQFGETFDSFLTEIQKLIRTCGYGDSEDGILRDRVVIGINDTKLQEKLLGREEEMDSIQVINLCRAAELARSQAKDVRGQKTGCIDSISNDRNRFQKTVSQFDKFKKKDHNSQTNKSKCPRCDWIHESNKCPAMGKTCNRCGKTNHFARMCTAKVGTEKPNTKLGQVSHVTGSQESSDSEYDYDSLYIGSVNLFEEKAWLETIKISNSPVKVKIDTGAEANCMNLKTFRKITANKVKLHPSNKRFDTYGGGMVKSEGMCFLVVQRGSLKFLQEFHIFDNDDVTLFGLESCELFGYVQRRNE